MSASCGLQKPGKEGVGLIRLCRLVCADLVNVSFTKNPALFGANTMKNEADVRKAATIFEAAHG